MSDQAPGGSDSAVETTAEARSYQPGSGEPLVVVGQLASGGRPSWRRRIETLTELAVGLVGSVRVTAAGQDRSPVRTDNTMRGDTLLGLALEGQRVALDAAELLVDSGARVARPHRPPANRAHSTTTASRVLEPARRRGAMYRDEATRLAAQRVPVYVGKAANTALDVVPLGDVLEHIDLNAVLDQLDLNALVGKLDLTALVEQTDLGAIIAHSTGGLASEGLDAVRRQGIGLDSLIFRWAARAMPKRLGDAPEGPPLLLQNDGEQHP